MLSFELVTGLLKVTDVLVISCYVTNEENIGGTLTKESHQHFRPNICFLNIKGIELQTVSFDRMYIIHSI